MPKGRRLMTLEEQPACLGCHVDIEGRGRQPDARKAGEALALAEERDQFIRERPRVAPDDVVDVAHRARLTSPYRHRAWVELARINRTRFHRGPPGQS